MRLTNTAFNATFPTLFLGIAAAFQLIAYYFYLGVKPDWTVAVLFSLLTSGTYLLNRVMDKEDKFNNVLRWRFFNESSIKTTVWITISVLSIIVPVILLMMMKKYNTALQFAIISIIGFVYTVKIIPIFKNRNLSWINIKEIPMAKTIIVCLIWSGSAIIIAASTLDKSILRNDLLLLFISIFFGSLNNAITTDARDIPGDKMRNIVTIPSLLGIQNTFKLLSFLSIAGSLAIGSYMICGFVNVPIALFSLVIIVWSYLCILPFYRTSFSIPKAIGELLLDSYLIVIAGGLIILGIFN
jgi:4-hydroxybenzoate polyprenyltransferase